MTVCVGAWLAAVCLLAGVGAALAAGRAAGLPARLLAGVGSGLADDRLAGVPPEREDRVVFPAVVFRAVVACWCATHSRISACATAHW